jgi:hypothetical protein
MCEPYILTEYFLKIVSATGTTPLTPVWASRANRESISHAGIVKLLWVLLYIILYIKMLYSYAMYVNK